MKYQNETLRVYKSEKSAHKARIAYNALHKKDTSEVFKTLASKRKRVDASNKASKYRIIESVQFALIVF
ncbi:MAG: hypothetical protein ACXWT0_01800 [Methylobacter sp.]